MKEKTRIAFIGAGQLARHVHYPSLASMEDVEIAALCDLDENRVRETGDLYKIAGRYTQYRKMLAEVKPDAVYAVGQPYQMYDVWAWCLERGHHLFVEKPLGLTLHQARNLAHLAAKHGCITQVGFQRRSTPLAVRLREECLKYGPVTHGVCRFYKCALQPYLGAPDHMMDDGVHAIDTLRWICGGEVVRVQSAARRVGTPDINFFSAQLEFDNGAVGLLVNSWSSGRRIFDAEIHAPGVCAELEHESKGYLYADGDTAGKEFDAREIGGGGEFHVYAGFLAKNREFIDAVREARLPSSHFGDALKTMEVADEILAQNRPHAWEQARVPLAV